MPDSDIKIKGLAVCGIDRDNTALLDADNVFWAIHKRNGALNPVISRETLSLYEKVKAGLDKEMADFRFSANLSAIYIDPTDRCNANCPYCYVPAKLRKSGSQMTYPQLRYALEKIRRYFNAAKKKPVIIFHASEPLLAKDAVFSAISDFKKYFKFGLQTNGILLKEEDVEFLKRHRVGVGISLDSPFPSVNNRLRPSAGGGNFDNVSRAIEWFDGYAGLNVIATMTKFNIGGLSSLVKFLHSRKVPCVLLNPVRFTQKNSLLLKPDEKLMTVNFLKAVDTAIRLTRESGRSILVANFTNIILSIVAPTARRLMCDISPCGGGRCFLTITASGEMVPCGEFIGIRNSSGGNIFKTGIKEAMESSPFKEIRSRIAEKVPECASCIYRNICGSPCPAELKSLGGLFQKAVFCEFYKETINHAFKLIATGREKYCLRQDSLSELNYQYRL